MFNIALLAAVGDPPVELMLTLPNGEEGGLLVEGSVVMHFNTATPLPFPLLLFPLLPPSLALPPELTLSFLTKLEDDEWCEGKN